MVVCGLAFKGVPETGDLRNSSAVEVAKLLVGRVGQVYGHDAVASPAAIAEIGVRPLELPGGFREVDAALFLNNHPFYRKLDLFNMARTLRAPAIVYDAWRLFRADDLLRACPCVYLGLGFARRSTEEKS